MLQDVWQENDDFELENEEYENDDDNDSEEKPFDADKIRVDSKPISVRQMYDLIKDEQLNLNPGFQRRQVWKDNKRKSLLIESLMLRIPIPVFYVYEDNDTIWHVVDGLQRMSTIYDFIDGKFKLSGLQYLKNSKGLKFENLEQKYKNRINSTTLTINVIDSTTPTQVKYDIFRRINTGGVPLNAQEIRNSTAKKSVRELLKNMANSKELRRITGDLNDTRMQVQELALRFIAFYNAYDFRNNTVLYKKGMDTFLDQTFDTLNKMNTADLQKYMEIFNLAMKNSYLLFGDQAFRRGNNGHNKKMPINKSMFTCVSVILSHYMLENRLFKQDKIFARLNKELDNNNKFSDALSKGTADVKSIKSQFKYMKRFIDEVIDYDKENGNKEF